MEGINLRNTIGALLVGALISAVLYGITSIQTVVYYQREQRDPRYIKGVVLALWILDTFGMCLIFHILYWYLITNYGNPLSITEPIWSIILHIMVTALTQAVVRGMFAVRILRLSQGSYIPVVTIGIVSATNLICSTVITAKAFHTTFVGLKALDPLVYLEFGSGFAGDFLVALCLCYLLHRSRTGFEKTESVIKLLMAYVINTGLLTAVTSSVSLMLFAGEPNNYIYVAVYLQLSKLYVNAYLAMLNSRGNIRERSEDATSIGHTRVSQAQTGPTIHTMLANPQATTVSMAAETDVETMDLRSTREYKGSTSMMA